jgi:hypothetical protein
VPRVKHVVFFRFKKEAPVGEIEAIFAGLADLRRVIPGILDFSAGSYASPEGLGRGFTHGFVMTFADEATRDIYLPHPDHEALCWTAASTGRSHSTGSKNEREARGARSA